VFDGIVELAGLINTMSLSEQLSSQTPLIAGDLSQQFWWLVVPMINNTIGCWFH